MVKLCDNALDVIDIDDLFEGKYQFPLISSEYRKYLTYNDLSTDLVDFYEDVKQYVKLYQRWKASRKRHDKKGGRDTDTPDSDIDGMNREDAGKGQSIDSLQLVPQSNRNSGNFDTDIDGIEVVVDAAHSTPSLNSKSNETGLDGGQKKAMQTSTDQLLNSKGSSAYGLNSGGTTEAKRVSSKTVSQASIKLFKKYLIADSPRFLAVLPEKSMLPIVNHYTKAMETAEKTGLRFIPSPERAFLPLLRATRHLMWENAELFPGFITFAVGNTVPSSPPHSPFKYRSPMVAVSYMQTLLFAVLAGCVILLKIFSNISSLALIFLSLPTFLMVSTYLLASRNLGFWLWVQTKREMLVLKQLPTAGDTDVTIKSNSIQGFNVASVNERDEEHLEQRSPEETVRIEVRSTDDPMLVGLQNGLMYRIFALALSTSFLVTAIFVFLWPSAD